MNDAILRNYDAIKARIIDNGASLHAEQIIARLDKDLSKLDVYEAEMGLGLRIDALCTAYNRLNDLHEQYEKLVWSAMWKALHDEAGMMPFLKQEFKDDLNQQCWQHIIEQIGSYKETPNGTMAGWLYRVAFNFVISWKRHQASLHRKKPTEQLHECIVNPPLLRRISKLLTPDRSGWRGRKWVLCPECAETQLVISSSKDGFTLACNHERGRAL